MFTHVLPTECYGACFHRLFSWLFVYETSLHILHLRRRLAGDRLRNYMTVQAEGNRLGCGIAFIHA